MSSLGPSFPKPSIPVGVLGKIVEGVVKIGKYAWSVITGKDEVQDKIADQKGLNPEKSAAIELAELNHLLDEYRKSIASAAGEMEREMIVECSMMMEDILEMFNEHNKTLKVTRTESIKRKFGRTNRELKGTFADYIGKRISLDDAECIKVLKLPSGEMKSQRLQELKQKVFVEAGEAVVTKIKYVVEDFSDTVEDAFMEHLERTEDTIQEKTENFKQLSKVAEDDALSVETVLLKADYVLAVCEYADKLISEEICS